MLVEWEVRGGASVAGSSLLHTDLHPLNILVSDRARVIDWAWSRLGAAWVDAAYLIIRLIDEGHEPDAAEDWAYPTGLLADVSSADLTAFSIAVTGTWTYLEHADPQTHRAHLTAAARRWAQYRLGQH
jgi:aminoglycoside phosphotransferase (APT) family kinase protein